MALAALTKRLFAGELQKLAKDKPIARISVAEICRSCGATRQTFYYHFHDKYDLVAWIYLQDVSEAAGPDGDMGEASLARMLETVGSKADFYRNALQDPSQNNLMSYIQEYGSSYILSWLERTYGLEPTPELEMAVRYHSYGVAGLTFDWLAGGCDEDARGLARILSRNIELLLQGFTK